MTNQSQALAEALRAIAEGNLDDMPWQANYERIRKVAADALSQYEKSDTDRDQLRDVEALVERAEDYFGPLYVTCDGRYGKPPEKVELADVFHKALASKTAIDPATERVAAWLEDMPETERQAFNLHAAGMIGSKNRMAGGIARIGDHILPYLASAIRALGKDQ